MNSLYTQEVRQHLRSRRWPVTYQVEEVEAHGHVLVPFLRIVLWRDDIKALTGDKMMVLHGILNDSLSKISKSGIPIFVKVLEGSSDNNVLGTTGNRLAP